MLAVGLVIRLGGGGQTADSLKAANGETRDVLYGLRGYGCVSSGVLPKQEVVTRMTGACQQGHTCCTWEFHSGGKKHPTYRYSPKSHKAEIIPLNPEKG